MKMTICPNETLNHRKQAAQKTKLVHDLQCQGYETAICQYEIIKNIIHMYKLLALQMTLQYKCHSKVY